MLDRALTCRFFFDNILPPYQEVPVLSEAMARKIIGGEGAEVLIEIVQAAWQQELDQQRPRHRSTRAANVWNNMVDLADEHLVAMEGVERMEFYTRPSYVLRDRMLLVLKKHSREWATAAYQTPRQASALQAGLFDEHPAAIVTCGYVLDRAEAGIEKIIAVRHVDNALEWAIDLPELAAGQLLPVADIFDGTETEDLNAVRSIRRIG